MGGLLGFLFKIVPTLFGSSSNGKGIVNSIADVIDRFVPSAKTRQENNESDKKATAESQDDARAMKFKSHDSWFDIFVDGVNRLIRPVITIGVISIIFGWVEQPDLDNIHPVILEVTLIVISFWFGGRFVVKDLMPAIDKWQERNSKRKAKEAEDKAYESEVLSDYPTTTIINDDDDDDDDMNGG